jgi:hypothetical protein
LDEHVASSIADGLRRRNIEVTTTAEAGLAGADDMPLPFSESSSRTTPTFFGCTLPG